MKRAAMHDLSEIARTRRLRLAGHVLRMPESKQACKCSSELASRNQQKTKRETTDGMATDVFIGSSRTEDKLERGKESSQ